jgi:fatty acid desaturase
MKKRAPWLVYGPVWFKQWFSELFLWLWELARSYGVYYLLFVMVLCGAAVWYGEGFWMGVTIGNLAGLLGGFCLAAIFFAILSLFVVSVEVACVPCFLLAHYFDWRLPDLPTRLAELEKWLAFKKRLEQSTYTYQSPVSQNHEMRKVKNQNSLLKLALFVVGVDLMFNVFGDDE